MIMNRNKLSGIFAPVVTPFRNDALDLDALRHNLGKLGGTELAGYLALGSNGEFKSLTDSEEMRVLEVFAEEKGGKVIMVGTGCESTRETIEKSNRAADMGFEYVSVLTPHYFPKQMDGEKLLSFYSRIADAVTVPVLVYNAPGFAGGVKVPPKTVRELSKHPNIAGMKDSSPTGPAEFLSVCDPADDFHILAGSVNFCYPSFHLGAPGGILSLSNALPGPCCDLYRLFVEGRCDEARALHFRLARLSGAVSGIWGVAGVKAAMDHTGFRGGEPRHPLVPVSAEGREDIRKAILAGGFEAV